MIDEDLLHQRLTAAAAAQDDLLPRALAEDLAGGRRRLRRRKLLAGGGVTGAVAAVAVVGVGMAGWLTPNAGPLPDGGPVAGQSSVPPTSIGPGPDTTGDKPVPAESGEGTGGDAVFVRNLNAAIYAHLDPQKVHLDFSSGGFRVDRQAGSIQSGGNRIGWRMPGQPGAEGIVGLSVHPANRKPDKCGSNMDVRVSCRTVQFPNGRTAQFGRKGDFADLLYQQPDGEWVSIYVSTLFGNNTEIPVHDMGITDQMLFALAQDNRLDLPKLSHDEQANENAMKNYKPSKQELHNAAVRALGGTITDGSARDVPEQLSLELNWHKGSASATIEIGVNSSVAVLPCEAMLSIIKTNCVPLTAPGNKPVMFGQRAMTYQGGPKYVIGGTYLQPDGDSAFVRVLYPGTKIPAGGLTKNQILALLTDPGLDK